jgi:hypothetical protein
MNDYISTGNRFRYDTAKKKWAVIIGACVRMAKLKPVKRAVFEWHWKEKNKLRNPDNFIAIGKKFILDALQQSGIIENDGWSQIIGFTDTWEVSDTPGVIVIIDSPDPE